MSSPGNSPKRNSNIKNRMQKGGDDIAGKQNPDGYLTPRQWDFVRNMADKRNSQSIAARNAGYASHKAAAFNLMRNPKITKQIAIARAEYAESANMDRKRIVEGFLEAVDIARMKADPTAMVQGWREIGRMCGFYEPQRTVVDVSVSGQVMVQQLQQMTDAQLIQILEEERANSEAIEGNFDHLVVEDEEDERYEDE